MPIAIDGDMDAKVGMDLARTVGVENELAAELQSRVDAVALLLLEVVAYYGDAILVGEGRLWWGRWWCCFCVHCAVIS